MDPCRDVSSPYLQSPISLSPNVITKHFEYQDLEPIIHITTIYALLGQQYCGDNVISTSRFDIMDLSQ